MIAAEFAGLCAVAATLGCGALGVLVGFAFGTLRERRRKLEGVLARFAEGPRRDVMPRRQGPVAP